MNRRIFLSLSALATAGVGVPPASSESSTALKLPTDGIVRDGGSRMIELGNGHRVWTKKVGDSPIKVLLLHGGPGGDCSYFECFEDFLPPNGIEFYYFNQLDSTNSDKPNDPKLWTIEGYRDQVESVRKGLGLTDFYLYGQSWGGLLAIEYALAYPKELKGLIISNMDSSIPSLGKHLVFLRSQLPADTLAIMNKYEMANDYDNPEYQRAMGIAYHRYICRLDPWPEPVQRNFNNFNPKIYNYFQGNNEFVITGAFKDWDRSADIHKIKTRTLIMGARYDEIDPESIRRMATVMPNAQAWISDKGSHFSMWDDQVPYFRALLDFLKS
jgi:proline iminopeptidase